MICIESASLEPTSHTREKQCIPFKQCNQAHLLIWVLPFIRLAPGVHAEEVGHETEAPDASPSLAAARLVPALWGPLQSRSPSGSSQSSPWARLRWMRHNRHPHTALHIFKARRGQSAAWRPNDPTHLLSIRPRPPSWTRTSPKAFYPFIQA